VKIVQDIILIECFQKYYHDSFDDYTWRFNACNIITLLKKN
jgi:hypothetical protein